jgi:hypothetical protein
VGFAEVEVREQVKQAGGKWNRSRKVWELRYAQVVALKLESRIVEEEASNTRYLQSIYMQMLCRYLHLDACL